MSSDFVIVVDPGESSTKIVYRKSVELGSPSHFLMPSALEPITKEELNSYLEERDWANNPNPIQQSWVKVGKELWAVGAFANEFTAQKRIREKKYENALYKVLAAVGVVARHLKMIEKKTLTIDLGMLLPYNEFCDRKLFQSALEKMLNSFEFRGTRLQVKLSSFFCRPEGGGVLLTYANSNQSVDITSRKMLVMMFGQRNVAMMYFENGEMVAGDSPLLGFAFFLDEVMKRIAGIDRQKLTLALFEEINRGLALPSQREVETASGHERLTRSAKRPDWKAVEGIQNLITARQASLRQGEIEQLQKVLDQETAKHWKKIKHAILELLPIELRNLNDVLISGGASRYFQPELEELFNCVTSFKLGQLKRVIPYSARKENSPYFVSIHWGDSDGSCVQSIHDTPLDRIRLADAYGMANCVIDAQKLPTRGR